MQTDPRLISDARRLGREEFARRYSHPFLGITVVTVVDDGAEHPAFDTGVHELGPGDLDVGGAGGETNVLAPVAKRRGASEYSFVTIGRAGNNDIVITAASVSKCHAMLEQAGEGYTVTDAGSRNGTTLNGVALPSRVPRPIESGDVLLFARGISAVFLDAEAAHSWLRRVGV